jgi:hypothetical protein
VCCRIDESANEKRLWVAKIQYARDRSPSYLDVVRHDPGNDTVAPLCNLLNGFAPGASVTPDVPEGIDGAMNVM